MSWIGPKRKGRIRLRLSLLKEAAYKSVQSAYGQTESNYPIPTICLNRAFMISKPSRSAEGCLKKKDVLSGSNLMKLKRDYDNAIESDSAQRDYIPEGQKYYICLLDY